jgi:hypothetical protein
MQLFLHKAQIIIVYNDVWSDMPILNEDSN